MKNPWILFSICLAVTSLAFSEAPPSKPHQWDQWKFNEKIAWRGCHLDPRIPYAPLADKLLVKKILEGEIPTAKVLFATDDPSQIFMENLPKTFIMKANNASGRGIFVKDGIVMSTRSRIGEFVPIKCTNAYLRSYAKQWLKNGFRTAEEKQYGLIKPMIFFEEFLEDHTKEIGIFYFNGKVRVIAVFFLDGYVNHPTVSWYDENWNIIDVRHPIYKVIMEPIEKPVYMDRLIAFGERFAEKMDLVRIDFFVAKDEVYFGEFTFTPGGGSSALTHLNQLMKDYWEFPSPEDPLTNSYLNHLLDRASSLSKGL